MKNLLIVLSLLFVAKIAQAQEVWTEMDELHSVVSQTFHPAEKGDLMPIMTRSAELAKSAKALMKSNIAATASERLKDAMKRLVKQTADLNKMVRKNKPEAEIKSALYEVHDTFHEIKGLCDD